MYGGKFVFLPMSSEVVGRISDRRGGTFFFPSSHILRQNPIGGKPHPPQSMAVASVFPSGKCRWGGKATVLRNDIKKTCRTAGFLICSIFRFFDFSIFRLFALARDALCLRAYICFAAFPALAGAFPHAYRRRASSLRRMSAKYAGSGAVKVIHSPLTG